MYFDSDIRYLIYQGLFFTRSATGPDLHVVLFALQIYINEALVSDLTNITQIMDVHTYLHLIAFTLSY